MSSWPSRKHNWRRYNRPVCRPFGPVFRPFTWLLGDVGFWLVCLVLAICLEVAYWTDQPVVWWPALATAGIALFCRLGCALLSGIILLPIEGPAKHHRDEPEASPIRAVGPAAPDWDEDCVPYLPGYTIEISPLDRRIRKLR